MMKPRLRLIAVDAPLSEYVQSWAGAAIGSFYDVLPEELLGRHRYAHVHRRRVESLDSDGKAGRPETIELIDAAKCLRVSAVSSVTVQTSV